MSTTAEDRSPGQVLWSSFGTPQAGGRGQRRPVGHVGIVTRQLGVRGSDAEFLLPGEHFLPVRVPALVKLARVAVRPFLRHVMRRVRGTEAQMQVERLGGIDLLDVGTRWPGSLT